MMDDRRQLTEDLLQARLILEPALAALAAQNGSEEEIKELEYILKELEGLIRDKKDYSEKDSQFHAQIATCSHNRVMTNLIPVITEGVRVLRTLWKKQNMSRLYCPTGAFLKPSVMDGEKMQDRKCISFDV